MKTSTRIIKAIAQTPIVKKIIDCFFDGLRQKYNKKLDEERNQACATYGVEVLKKFDDCMNEQVIDEIKKVDLNTLSPYECMSLLFDWKKRLG